MKFDEMSLQGRDSHGYPWPRDQWDLMKCHYRVEILMTKRSVRFDEMSLQGRDSYGYPWPRDQWDLMKCHYRVEILMAIHDQEINEICSVDACHKFAWCVDACVREKNINPNRARELQGFLDGIRKGQENVLGWAIYVAFMVPHLVRAQSLTET